MSDELLKQRIKRELRTRGVRVNRLLLDVSKDRIVISGELATYYEVQLVQAYATKIAEGREVYNNVSVVQGVLDSVSVDTPESENRDELHLLRNRLNELTLGVRLLDQVLSIEDLPKAKIIVADMLRSIESSELQSRNDIGWMSRLALLVIEDDSHQSLLLSGLLRNLGADVARADDRDSTFRVLNEGFTPDVVLLDMHLPDSSGAEIAKAIRKRRHCEQTRIIVLSGTHPSEGGLDLDEGEVDDWLPKPINVEKLLQTIRKVSY
ncbi:MAG: response regulator [Rubripirellula sp.]